MVKSPACEGCVLERTGTGFVKLSPPVSYDGIKLLIQGEAPLSERTEHWLRRNILQNAGIPNSAVLVDFTLRCLAPRNRTGGHYPIGADRAQAESQCRAYDIWDSAPCHIPLLLMGGKAIEQRLGLKSISNYHGHITLLGGRVTGCTYDAESVRKNPNLLPVVIREICNLLEAAQDPAIAVSRPSVHKHEILEPGDKPRVLDLEWDINDDDRITVVGTAECATSAYSTFAVPQAREAIKAHRGPLVGHNLLDADIPRLGIELLSFGPEYVFDTKIVAHLIHPHLAELGLYGLGDLCRIYAPTQDWKQDKGDLLHYNGLDCAYNFRLYQQLCADLDSTQQWHLVEKQQRLAEMTRLMHLRGIKVDSDAIRSFDTQWRTKREEIKAQFEFNPNSPKQVKEYFKAQGIVLRDTTFKTIDRAAAKHPFLARLRDYKDEGKPISVWFNAAAADDGFIYPRFNVTGTEVARFSCAGPNCQNIPPYLRHIIVPRGNEQELVSWDFSQIENRCIAKLAQDDVMLADFDSGLDFHRLSASRIFAKRPEEVTDEQRKQGKITIHATNYCETAHHLAERVRGDRTQHAVNFARGLQDAYFRAYPRIKQWQDGIAAQLDSGDLLLRNPWGRVRAIYAQDSHERKKRGCHFLGCSSAAEVVNQRALDVWAELGLLPILVVHDELVYELERGETILRNRISEILNAPVAELGGLRIPAKLKVGVNYGFNG